MGKVIIETDLDNSGVQKGLDRLGGILKTGVASAAKLSLSALAVVSTAIGAVTGTAVKFGTEYKQASNQIQAETGATAEEMEGLKDIMQDVYADNFGDNMQDAAAGVAEVKKQLGGLVQEDAFKDLTEDAFMMRDTFGYDVPESIRSVSTMIKQFGIDGAGAFNLIAQANQRGLDYSGELLDSINEYAVQFNKVGLDATDMFNIFESGMKNGAFNLDKIGDAVKEFSIRAIDGSKTTSEGFKLIGLNADEMGAKFAAGGDQAKEAFYQTIKALREMDDPLAQSTAGVDLFGTMWEDLGPAVVTQLDAVKDGYDATKDSMQAINDVKYDDATSALEALKRSVEVKLLAPISERVMPTISDATNAAIGYIDRIANAYETGGISGLVDETANVFAECASKASAQAPKMIDAAVTFIQSFVQGLSDNSSQLLNAGIQIVRTLSRGIVSFLPTEIQKPIQKTVYMITSSLKDGGLREAIHSVKNLFGTLGTILTRTAKVVLPPLTKAVDFLGDNLKYIVPLIGSVTVGIKAWSILNASAGLIKKVTTAWQAATTALAAHEAANRLTMVASSGCLTAMQTGVGLLTGKIGLATAAQAAWNVVLNANPIALAVTAVAALTAGLALFCAMSDDTKERTEKLNETFGKIGESAANFYDGISTAKSHLSEFNDELFASSEEQQELQNNMSEVQNGITAICRTAAEERRGYTEEEIQQLDEYFERLRELEQRELEIEHAKADAVKQQALTIAETHQGSLEEYQAVAQEWINTAQEQAEQEKSLIEQQTTTQLTLLNQRYGDQAVMTNQAYADEYNALMADKEQKLAAVTAGLGEINAAYANGYAERSGLTEIEKQKVGEDNISLEQENARHAAQLSRIFTDHTVDQETKDLWLEHENNRHKDEMAQIWSDLSDDMSDEQKKQLGVYIAMAAQTELYGGKLETKADHTAKSVVDSFDSMPAETREAMSNAMSPMLEEMQAAEPGLFAKASGIANGILNRLKTAFDIHSPSRKTRKIFRQVIEGAECGWDDETPKLLSQVDALMDDIDKRLDDFSSPTIDIGVNADEVPASLLQQIKSLGMTGVQKLVSRAKMAVAIETAHVSAELTARANLPTTPQKIELKQEPIDYGQLANALIEALMQSPIKLVLRDGRLLAELITPDVDRIAGYNMLLKERGG